MLLLRLPIGLLVLGLCAPLAADEAAPEPFNPPTCTFCQWPWGWEGQAEFGPALVSDGSLRFANGRGLDEQGVYLSLGGNLAYRDARGRYLDLRAINLGLDSRRLQLQAGRRGAHRWKLTLEHTPWYRGAGAVTPFMAVTPGQLSLPPGWQPGDTTADMNLASQPFQAAPLRTLRKLFRLDFEQRLGSRWRWEFSGAHERKTGTRPFGAGVFLLNASQLPAPVDQSDDRFRPALNYARGASTVQAGWQASWFDNDTPALTWDNPFTPRSQETQLRAALAPDSRTQQLYLNAATGAPGRWRAHLRLVTGRQSQDDAFLPYTSNPAVPERPLPRAQLDGRVDLDTVDGAGGLRLKLSRRLDVQARLRWTERDNRSPVDAWNPVLTDLIPRGPEFNRPLDFKRRDASVEARWRLNNSTRVRFGAGQRREERSLQAVQRTDESRAWLEAGGQALPWLGWRARLEVAGRNGSPYAAVNDPGLPPNPRFRQYHLADRDREQGTLALDVTPGGAWTVTTSIRFAEDDYPDSPLGLQDSRHRGVGLDITHPLGSSGEWSLTLSHDRYEATLLSEEGPGQAWGSHSDDRFSLVATRLSQRWSERWRASVDIIWALSESRTDTQSDTGSPPFPEQTDRRLQVRGSVSYQATARWTWLLRVDHEQYRSRDWQSDATGPGALASVLTLGLGWPSESATAVHLLGRYRFTSR